MSTRFIPTIAAYLYKGAKLGAANERVSTPVRDCREHPGNVFFEIEGYGADGKYNGIHSDVCVDPMAHFTLREPTS